MSFYPFSYSLMDFQLIKVPVHPFSVLSPKINSID
jgi:hypothetical protein